jgi:hypothetical protein
MDFLVSFPKSKLNNLHCGENQELQQATFSFQKVRVEVSNNFEIKFIQSDCVKFDMIDKVGSEVVLKLCFIFGLPCILIALYLMFEKTFLYCFNLRSTNLTLRAQFNIYN